LYMPELPEVEITVRRLDAALGGAVVESVSAPGMNVMKTFEPPLEELVGNEVTGVRRVGKMPVVEFGELALLIHLMSAGRLRVFEKRASLKDRASRVLVRLEGGRELRLREFGTRQRAWAKLLPVAAVEEEQREGCVAAGDEEEDVRVVEPLEEGPHLGGPVPAMVDRRDREEHERGGREDRRAGAGGGVGGERDQDDTGGERERRGRGVQPAPQLRLDLDERVVDVLAEVVGGLRGRPDRLVQVSVLVGCHEPRLPTGTRPHSG